MKAGTLSGVLYLGGMAAFNVVLLYSLQADVFALIQRSYPAACSPVAAVNGTTVADCFASVVAVDVPYIAFVGFFISLIYSGIFGRYYDSIPLRGSTLKGEAVAVVVGLNLLAFGFSGFLFNFQSTVATLAFFAVWTAVFGYILGRLYKKYTRLVEFQSQDDSSLRVVVDGKDYTGKKRTLALTSTHKVTAQVTDDASFKGWEASGGLSVEDTRSFETLMEVTGEGVLKGLVGKKY